MFKFLLYEPIHEVGMKVLQEVGEVRLASGTDEETIISEIGDIDGVIIRARGAMTRHIMEHAPKLKVVGRHGVGVDNIDLEAATEHGIQVVNTPYAVTEGVAEHALGMMIALSKKIFSADAALRRGNFAIRYEIRGRELRGRTLGIIGFGRIGQRLAEICHKAFEMAILYADVRPALEKEKELNARRVPMEELLRTAEYISVHVPLLPETRHLIGEKEFSLMRPDALFFNLSRGPVVDEKALYQALVEGKIAGAGLDVFEQEPTPADNPLFALDNVVLTPHIATATEEALKGMALVAEDVVAVLQGKPPKYPVNHLSKS
ncbi:MAG: hydroxyacid dehydrogenase [Anaerolineae bacterium]|nr:hydroxyacid dehydrogenase [Anaerolineae bacterium]